MSSATAPQTIICGVTCDCAPKANPSTSISHAPCSARESCSWAKSGACRCPGEVCEASEAKRGCDLGIKGQCDCAPNACRRAESAHAACANKGSCACNPGQCVQAGFIA